MTRSTRPGAMLSIGASALALSAIAGAAQAQPLPTTSNPLDGLQPVSHWNFGNIMTQRGAALVDSQLGRHVRLFSDGTEVSTLAAAAGEIVPSNATDINGFNSDFLNFTNSNAASFGLIDHNAADQLSSGAVFLRGINSGIFNGGQFGEGVLSKDAQGFGDGGHFSIQFQQADTTSGYLEARLQAPGQSVTIITSELIPLELDMFLDVMVTFGPDLGFGLYVDRDLSDDQGLALEDWNGSILTGLENNQEPWILGSSAVSVNPAASLNGGVPEIGDLRSGLSGGIAGITFYSVPAPGTVLAIAGMGVVAARRRR